MGESEGSQWGAALILEGCCAVWIFDFWSIIIHVLGYGVPVGFFAGFSFIPPLGKTAAWTVAVGPFFQTRGLSDLSPAL